MKKFVNNEFVILTKDAVISVLIFRAYLTVQGQIVPFI